MQASPAPLFVLREDRHCFALSRATNKGLAFAKCKVWIERIGSERRYHVHHTRCLVEW